MRTTITIEDELLRDVLKVSGKKGYSQAIVTTLRDYLALQKRLSFLDKLFTTRLPHSVSTLKRRRKSGTWSS
ncbi:MAG: type II toxin-antitoxin system VapB family antitoxin [Deltaproteobacteria bacterium]|nr:type II toxin-antitoxin system VapB family antitoxin [Deltaproteobacteria bacterium]